MARARNAAIVRVCGRENVAIRRSVARLTQGAAAAKPSSCIAERSAVHVSISLTPTTVLVQVHLKSRELSRGGWTTTHARC